MARALNGGILLLLAPAGCGKSVALQQFLAGHEIPSVRYDVRPEHGSLLGFVRGLADAAHEIAPGARATVAEAFRNAGSPSRIDLADWMSTHLRHFRGTIAID